MAKFVVFGKNQEGLSERCFLECLFTSDLLNMVEEKEKKNVGVGILDGANNKRKTLA